MRKNIIMSMIGLFLLGCSSQDIPPSHKGRMFDKTGPMAAYSGGKGFQGPVLGPGTYYLGIYPEIRMVDCGQKTVMESLDALTKDGVQFKLNVYISFGANCDEESAVFSLLSKLTPGGTPDDKEHKEHHTISSTQIYRTFVIPALGEAVRESISPYIANHINDNREKIFNDVKASFEKNLASHKPNLVTIYGLNLSNLDFPDSMDKANLERATQAILKDKSIAEREKVLAEIETAKLQIVQESVKAEAEAAKINVIGKALHNNPEYYVRDVYYYAADKGGSVMIPQDPKMILQITPKLK